MNNKLWIGLAVVIVGLFGLWWWLGGFGSQVVVTSFNECVEAGNPVMESYPRQCRHGGQTFVENIGNGLEKTELITVDSVVPNSAIASPLTITGQAVGPWYFEASFPVELKDGLGVTIATSIAQAQADWMTTAFVPFVATLTFVPPATPTGTLILHKDNPSGEPVNDDQLTIPVVF